MTTAISRRAVLAAGLGTVAALGAGSVAYAAPDRPTVHPRAAWAGGRSAQGPLADEDVRLLIIHHSESPNTETPRSIPGRLRGFFDYHTGPKGWPDVAYNFFVDPFGEIWEGRTGSLAGPVRGDATGGSQGFAQLCCFVGDHTATPPTEAALTAMTALVAWLAGRHGIDLWAGTSIAFTSRGSNRWPRGARVTTDPVVGHRDMSRTSCPGEALYPLVRSRILPGAQALVQRPRAATSITVQAAPEPTAAPSRSRPVDGAASVPAVSPAGAEPVATATPGAQIAAPGRPGIAERLGDLAVPLAVGAGILGVGVMAGGVVVAHKGP